jgi:hypothetical protein
MLIALIIFNKRKNNRIKQATKSVQNPRPSSTITSDTYTNPVYMNTVVHPSYSGRHDIDNFAKKSENNIVDIYDDIDLNLPGEIGHYSRTRPLVHDDPVHVYSTLSGKRQTLRKNPIPESTNL